MVVQHIRLDDSGRIYVAGYTDTSFGKDVKILRLASEGLLDHSYGDEGAFVWSDPASSSFSESVHDLVVEPDGVVWLAGGTNWASWRPFIIGVGSGGALNEELLIPPKTPAENILDIDLFEGGLQVVVAVEATSQSKYSGEIWRLDKSGLAFNSQFGNAGKKGILLNENSDSGRPYDCEFMDGGWFCVVALYEGQGPGPGVYAGRHLAKYDGGFFLDAEYGNGGYYRPVSNLSGMEVDDFHFKLLGDELYLAGKTTEGGRLYQSKLVSVVLDQSWGQGGEAEVGYRLSAEQATSMSRNVVGDTLISGVIGTEAFLLMRHADGSRNNSFGDFGFFNLSEFNNSVHSIIPVKIEPVNDDLFIVLGSYSFNPDSSGGYALFLVSKSGVLEGGVHVKKVYEKFFPKNVFLINPFFLIKRQDGDFAVGHVSKIAESHYLNIVSHEIDLNSNSLLLGSVQQKVYPHQLELLALSGMGEAKILALVGGEFPEDDLARGIEFNLDAESGLAGDEILFDLAPEFYPLGLTIFPGMDAVFLSGALCNESNDNCNEELTPFVSVLDFDGNSVSAFNSGQPLVLGTSAESLGVNGGQVIEQGGLFYFVGTSSWPINNGIYVTSFDLSGKLLNDEPFDLATPGYQIYTNCNVSQGHRIHCLGYLNFWDDIVVLGLQSLNDSDGDGLLDLFDSAPINLTDTDLDGMSDTWELNYRLDALTNDASLDLDGDNLTNLQEFEYNSNPTLIDSDGDSLSDFDEVIVHLTNPLKQDTDSDAMPDNWELDNGFNPLDPSDAVLDADNDGLSNFDEYIIGTRPNEADSDGDGVIDSLDSFPLDASASCPAWACKPKSSWRYKLMEP